MVKMEAGLDSLKEEDPSVLKLNLELSPQKQQVACFGSSYGCPCTKSFLPVVRATVRGVGIDVSQNLLW